MPVQILKMQVSLTLQPWMLHCISLPSSCISAAAGEELVRYPISCNQNKKEAHIMKLKLITDPALPEPEVTVASAPKDREAERIVQALQSATGSLFAYLERAGTAKERVPYTAICSLESDNEGTILHMADGRTLFAPMRLSALEDRLPKRLFVRISRQMVVNLDQAKTIRPEFGSRLVLGLSDGSEGLVTRSHVADVKERIGIPQKGDRK